MKSLLLFISILIYGSCAWAYHPLLPTVCQKGSGTSCSGNYGHATITGDANPNFSTFQLRVQRVPVCSGGTPTLNAWLQQISTTDREVIAVMYANVPNGAGDADDRPGALIWNSPTPVSDPSITSTGTSKSFSPGQVTTGDYVWIGIFAESSATATYYSATTGYYRYYTASSFDVSQVPNPWPAGDTGGTAALYAFYLSY